MIAILTLKHPIKIIGEDLQEGSLFKTIEYQTEFFS
jgi:hypothetical protein